MKPDKRRSPAAALPSSVPSNNVTSTSDFTTLGAAAEGALREFPALYIAHKYGLPLAFARVVCELAEIGRRAA